jgi:hypothetical protein
VRLVVDKPSRSIDLVGREKERFYRTALDVDVKGRDVQRFRVGRTDLRDPRKDAMVVGGDWKKRKKPLI